MNGKRSTFRNENPDADRNFRQVARWALSRKPKPWPRRVENRIAYSPVQLETGQLAITFVNHSTFLIRANIHGTACAILTDPVWADRAFPVQWMGPARVHDPGIPFEALPRVDVVLVSHNHYDHMDLHTLRRLQQRFSSHIVTTLGNKAYLEARGLSDVIELGWWDTTEVSGTGSTSVSVTATPAQHFSARTPFDRNRTLWAGFAIEVGDRTLFFTGDSGYHTHFVDIGSRLGPFHAALVPIGAYEPRWFMCAAHMNPEEAVQAHLDLRSSLTIAMHFGCFQLTDESIDEPVRDLGVARTARGVPASAFRVPEPGETFVL